MITNYGPVRISRPSASLVAPRGDAHTGSMPLADVAPDPTEVAAPFVFIGLACLAVVAVIVVVVVLVRRSR